MRFFQLLDNSFDAVVLGSANFCDDMGLILVNA